MSSESVPSYREQLQDSATMLVLSAHTSRRRVAVASRDIPGLSDALKWAVQTLRNPFGQRWTVDEIAVEVSRLGTPLSSTYLRQLIGGRDAAVSAMVITNISEVLGLPSSFFLDPVVQSNVRKALDSEATASRQVAEAVRVVRNLTHAQQRELLEAISHEADRDSSS
ncbi:MAG: hypothetical protein M3Y49_19170 [Actinomycetota bacterium]|nr:hypothetical protein [Actinomycetota bacterium]